MLRVWWLRARRLFGFKGAHDVGKATNHQDAKHGVAQILQHLFLQSAAYSSLWGTICSRLWDVNERLHVVLVGFANGSRELRVDVHQEA